LATITITGAVKAGETSGGKSPEAAASGLNKRTIQAGPDTSLLKTLQDAGLYLPAICGGRGTCGKCKIRVTAGTLPPGAADRNYFSESDLAAGRRLSCAAFPAEDISIEISDTGEQNFAAVNSFDAEEESVRVPDAELFSLKKDGLSFARQLSPGKNISLSELRELSKLADAQGRIFTAPSGAAQTGAAEAKQAETAPPDTLHVYRERGRILHIGGGTEALNAVAIDIGTTTLAFALIDLRRGKITGRLSAVNRQREFGGDVISRIQSANGGNLSRLSQCIRSQISAGMAELCAEAGAAPESVVKIAITGNTTMLHLLLCLSCQTLGQNPFTPVTLDMVFMNYRELFEGEFFCEVAVLPGISTYVGADITAGILFAGIHQSPEPVAFMDIGTNGEMALAFGGKMLCTATAAGPAFEGGNILWGTGSVPGAISKAQFRKGPPAPDGKSPEGQFEITTIGGKAPVGICGSGVVDIVYQGLVNGLILPSGRFDKKNLPANEIFLAGASDGRDIVFCQKDVRELQLGKSAVRSGLDAMLNYAGLGYDDIKTLYIAGGFGFNLNLESGAGIGLIPRELLPRVSLIGNSALGGTVKYLLNPDYAEDLYRITEEAGEFSLPSDKYFNSNFINNVNFD
jgi:uncharacterized 2Fe-2S/4Fe-4S cluster protein (DUF4445 family)